MLTIVLGGPVSLRDLSDLAEHEVKERLERLPGVGGVNVLGAREREIRIWLDPLRLEGYGLSIQDVAATLRQENAELASGRIEGDEREWSVTTQGKARRVEDFGALVVAERAGRLRAAARRGARRGRHGRGAQHRPPERQARGGARDPAPERSRSGGDRPPRPRGGGEHPRAASRRRPDRRRARLRRLHRGAGPLGLLRHGPGDAAGDERRAALPARGALHLHRLAGDSVERDRVVHLLLRLRPLAQHHDADRALAGDRPRDRRRDRGAREHLPQARGRRRADARRPARGTRGGAGGRLHHPGGLRRLRADRLHAEHHRPLLLRVRRGGDGGRLRVDAGRADADADAGQPRAAGEARAGAVLPHARARAARPRRGLPLAARHRDAPPGRHDRRRPGRGGRGLRRRLHPPLRPLHERRPQRGGRPGQAADRHAVGQDRALAASHGGGGRPASRREERLRGGGQRDAPRAAPRAHGRDPDPEGGARSPDRADLRGAARGAGGGNARSRRGDLGRLPAVRGQRGKRLQRPELQPRRAPTSGASSATPTCSWRACATMPTSST